MASDAKGNVLLYHTSEPVGMSSSAHFRLTKKILIMMFLITTGFSPISYSDGNGLHVAQAQTNSGDSNRIDDDTLQITNSSVSKRYDYQGEVQITFPDTWTGLEISQDNGRIVTAAVSPKGLTSLKELDDADAIMFLVVSEKASLKMVPGSIPPMLSRTSNNITFDCELRSSKMLLINGVFSEESISACLTQDFYKVNGDDSTNNTSTSNNTMIHSVLTQTGSRWIAVILYGTPNSVETHEIEFETALKTFDANDLVDFYIPFGMASLAVYTVNANGSEVHVAVKSASNITQFEFDENNKAISFTAEGLPGTDGISEITIGRVLEGPYIVTVNGEIWNDFDTLTQETPRESKMQIRYEHGISEVIIKGTQVVPEFPIDAMFGSAAAMSSMMLGGGLAALVVLAQLYIRRVEKRSKSEKSRSS